jgi:NodT family efflux transporter outer membrane factor (OMF) lipoprotein
VPQIKYSLITLIASLTVGGCAVGPDFQPPSPPTAKTYAPLSFPEKTASIATAGNAGKAQHFLPGQAIPAAWWALYHSVQLNNLIRAGLANSPNLAAAKAALRQAQENFNAQIGTLLFPSISAQFTPQRQSFASSSIGGSVPSSVFNLYNASINVTYALDIFGNVRRQIEAGRARVDYEYYELNAAYLSLTANIVTTAITVASLQAQITATQQLIQADVEQLSILKKQFNLGGASKENVLSQQTLLEQTRALLPPLEKTLAQSQHALAVLVGSTPNQSQLPNINLDKLILPTQLPLSLPSSLVRQRPDIQAAEALLHQASAQVGVATANLYPQITLNGNYGWTSNTLNTLFHPISNVWAIGGQLLQPIFNGDALRAQRRAAIAAYEQAYEQYEQTILQAFQNVADSLQALEIDARELKAQKSAEAASRATLLLTKKQFHLGATSYINVLNAEQQYQQILIKRIQAQTARYSDTAALFQALGGGWWNGAVIE